MKKALAILLLLVMVFALAACGETATESPSAQPVEDQTVAPPEPTVAQPDPTPAPPDPTPAPPADLIKVGIINNPPSESGYRQANVEDMEKVFSEANGYQAQTFYDKELDPQLNAARQFITDGVDYLLISAANTDGWDQVLQSAKDAGIKVYLFDRMINTSEDMYEAAVVSDMATQGNVAVAWLEALNLDEYKIIHIQGQMGSDAQIGRTAALDAKFASGWTKVVQQTASWNENEAQQIVKAAIDAGDDFNIVYAENDGMAWGAAAALDAAGITHGVDGKVIIMGFDTNRWAFAEIMAGRWNYSGQCSPFQAQVISDMIQGVRPIEKKVISDEKGYDATGVAPAIKVTQEVSDAVGLGPVEKPAD